MSTAAQSLTFRSLKGDPPGYGPTLRTSERPGRDGARFYRTGARGGETTMTGIAYATDLNQARQLKAYYEAKQAGEYLLTGEVEEITIQAVLLQVNATYQKIVHTDPLKTYRIIVTLRLKRTA